MNEEFVVPEIPENPFDSIDLLVFKDEITQNLENIFKKVKKKILTKNR